MTCLLRSPVMLKLGDATLVAGAAVKDGNAGAPTECPFDGALGTIGARDAALLPIAC